MNDKFYKNENCRFQQCLSEEDIMLLNYIDKYSSEIDFHNACFFLGEKVALEYVFLTFYKDLEPNSMPISTYLNWKIAAMENIHDIVLSIENSIVSIENSIVSIENSQLPQEDE